MMNASKYSDRLKGLAAGLLGLAVVFGCPVEARALSDEATKLFQEGQAAASRGEHQKAVQAYEKVVEMDSNFAPVYAALAESYEQLNAPVDDVAWFYDTATSIDPQFIEAYDNLCRVSYQGSEFDRAETACLSALKINPNYGSSQMSLAWIYLLGKSQPDKAIYYFQKVLERVKHPKIYFGLGMAYSMNGDRAEVLDVVTNLRSMGENDLAAQLERTIRSNAPQPLAQDYLPMPQRQPGTIVRASPEQQPQQTTVGSSTPVNGQMRIRLRGTLTNVGGGAEQGSPETMTGSEPQPSSENASSSDGVQHSTGTSAIERIRKLRRIQRGEGTTGTTVQGGY